MVFYINLYRTTAKDDSDMILVKIIPISHELEHEQQQLFRKWNNIWIEVYLAKINKLDNQEKVMKPRLNIFAT